MIKRTLFFGNPYHLKTKNKQLIATEKETGVIKTIPIEDIGFIVFEHPQISFTQSVIQLLNNNNTAVIFCNEKYLPTSMLLNLDGNTVQSELFKYQVSASTPLKKGLWQQTIKQKIRNQAQHLKLLGENYTPLLYHAKNVLSNDSTNREAIAAKYYWNKLLGNNFRRDRFGDAPNNLLNYGYIVLRAAVARSLVGSGLLATLGIHHRNKYNAFCLADDIIEPYRIFADKLVLQIIEKEEDISELTTPIKAQLLTILTQDIFIGQKKRPLMAGLSETTASLARCFKGEDKNIKYPTLCG